jgi:signal transduction histidine kinase
MPDGGALTIETENVDLTSEQSEAINGAIPGSYVRLSVTNTGSGMSTQVLEKLFDPFLHRKKWVRVPHLECLLYMVFSSRMVHL